jgi:hypothetical protein
MGQTADQIEQHIAQTRDTLGTNLEELEHKVKAVTDWKQQFQKHPMTMIGFAFGGGVLLAAMLGGRKRNGQRFPAAPPSGNFAESFTRKHQAFETLDAVKGALLGVAATKIKDYVEGIVPGFGDHFNRAQQKANVHRGAESFG